MPTATLTSKGQITIPKKVRDSLSLRPGERVDFVLKANGEVVLKRATVRIEELAGILRRRGRKSVSVEQMNKIIRARGGSRI